jgi:hypothetical protein
MGIPQAGRGGSFRALTNLGGAWAGSLDLHGMPVASIRLEAQASAAPWPVPRSRPPLRGLRHPAALSVVFVPERLAAEHAALPERGTAMKPITRISLPERGRPADTARGRSSWRVPSPWTSSPAPSATGG